VGRVTLGVAIDKSLLDFIGCYTMIAEILVYVSFVPVKLHRWTLCTGGQA